MAHSRRRERELARRRYERRRLREQQERARRRRRNTVIGAVAGTVVVVGGITALALTLSGSSSKNTLANGATPTPPVASSAPATPTPAGQACAPISPNPPAKGQPMIPPVKGKPPADLVVKDVTAGTGPAAKKGDSLKVTYIGVGCSTGKVFDASYLHGGTPFTVSPLGSAQVITGWNNGLVGVKAGGVRELVIPPALGYGASGSPPTIAPNETLIFLITVESVK